MAEDKATGKSVGFASVDVSGYIHSMFVIPSFQRCGVASLLIDKIEDFAARNNIEVVYSEVSLTALSFFSSKGYIVECEQFVVLNGVAIKNFIMNKKI